MSGHSKWATIKHKKGAADKARGKLFAKLIRQVEVAAREGGGDPDANPTLRTMFQKARDASVPLDTIERAIKRGTGDLEGVRYEAVTYEGYAPNGVAVLVDVLTDNRNRTGSDVRGVLKKYGGSIAEPGAVAWQFERKGVVILPRAVEEDDIMLAALDAGAEDLVDEGDTWRLTTAPADLNGVRDALTEAGLAFDSADSTMLATSTVPLDNADAAKSVLRVIDALEELDDVQDVYANFDVPDDVLQDAVAEVAITVGDAAPEFVLAGTDGTPDGHREYALSEYRGQPVVLVFYPADNSPVCTVQLNTYSHDITRFSETGAAVLAISPQSVQEHDDWAASQGGFAFPLLADEDKAVGEAYGILGPVGFYRRSVFVIDRAGIVRYAHRSTAGLTFRPVTEIIEAVAPLT